MILSYIKLVGNASAKDIFNNCIGTYIKQADVPADATQAMKPVEMRGDLTRLIQAELDHLVETGLVRKYINSIGQIFYSVWTDAPRLGREE